MHGAAAMKITDLSLAGLKLIELPIYNDSRGFFVERFHVKKFQEAGLPLEYAQDNHSRSLPRVLRGLHFQTEPAQGKLVGVIRGRIWDVVVDIRRGSATFGKTQSIELSDTNGKLLWVPAGFAHGFCVLGDEPADVFYKVDSLYAPSTEGGIRWDDPELKIEWPVRDPIISDKDTKLPSFADFRKNLK
jgi:dTDP-4-dehydrorhamnose 3,5-epimerase